MSSTSSSPLPDDAVAVENQTSSTSRRSPRKKACTSAPDDIEMLQSWIQHDDHSYHLDFLSPERAYKIRIALVEWYRANRRKLPWRGDAGPYDGSTAGFGAGTAGNRKKAGTKKRKDEGKDIRTFFGASANKKKKTSAKKPANNQDGSEANALSLTANTAPREVTAYGVWVSEIMLQQTRVEAVIPYYLKWMQRFPTVHDLADATDEEVNSHWAGLGFYRRARLLHTGAKRVVNEYSGVVPNTVDELLKVEGIGRYTASAIASIAYGVDVPVVDGNVCRVLSRLTGIANHIKAGVLKDDLGWTLADRIIQAKCSSVDETKSESYETIGYPGEVNQAIMELGATYCSPSGSGIEDADPLKEFYISTQLGVAVGQAMRESNNTVRGQVDSLVSTRAFVADEQGSKCRLCDADGVSTAFFNIMDRMTDDFNKDSKTSPKSMYAIAGHASLPIPPPKKSKREEVIAVAVISSQASDKEQRWLMVKRPCTGLLANQWEFPSVIVWTSADESKAKGKGKKASGKKAATIEVPLIDAAVRSNALDAFLSDVAPSADMNERAQLDDSVVHIFSHVCHTMWVECGECDADFSPSSKRWKLDSGREAGWMTEDDMASVGVTSGVRKVLAKAQQSHK
ncbi:hypothetical protein ACHAXT_004576 [Thalassiosira profunda]